jgi:PPP family 3-phenylpropionic acid transporter
VAALWRAGRRVRPGPTLLASAYYYFFFGAVGAYFPFVGLFYQELGLSGLQIGLLAGIGPLCNLTAGTLWSSLADRFRLHRPLLVALSFAPLLPALFTPLVREFGALAALALAANFFAAGLGPLIDSAALELVEGTTQSYGDIRLWGTLGYISHVLLVGWAVQSLGLAWLFYSYAVSLGLAGVAALGLPARQRILRTTYSAGLRRLLAQPSFSLFLAGSLVSGAAVYGSFSFYSIHLQMLGGAATLVGYANALSALSELPVLRYSQKLLRWIGAWGSMMLGGLTYAVRWALVGIAGQPLAVLLTQAMHGLSFGAFLVGSVAYADERAPAGLNATAQALLTAASFGLGAALGAGAGGWAFDALGATGFFLTAAATNLVGLLFLIAARRSESRQSSIMIDD